MRIIVDMDGIVADSMVAWLDKIHEKTGIRATLDDVKAWEFYNDPPFNAAPKNSILEILQEPDFHARIKPLPGAIEALKSLHEEGHDLRLVTARHGPVSMPATLAWVKDHLPFLSVETNVLFVVDKWLVKGDVIIDDKLANLEQYREHHPNAKLVAIMYKYNTGGTGIDYHERHPKVWEAILKTIRGYNGV